MSPQAETFFEDLRVGDKFTSSGYRVTTEDIKSFAAEFDPQQFHLDEAFAEKSLFHGLAASGWHTAAITMRLFVQTMNFAGGVIGLGVDELKWPAPVRVGDTLQVVCDILELRESRSLEQYGIIKIRNVTRNQNAAVVQSYVASAMVPRKAPRVS